MSVVCVFVCVCVCVCVCVQHYELSSRQPTCLGSLQTGCYESVDSLLIEQCEQLCVNLEQATTTRLHQLEHEFARK